MAAEKGAMQLLNEIGRTTRVVCAPSVEELR
jgi:hypothetical protein